VQRRSTEQNRDIEPFLVHGGQLRHVIVIPRQRIIESIRHSVFVKTHHVTGRPDRLAVAEEIARHAMFRSRLAARNPFAPLWIHVFDIKIGGLEDMHIAVESAKTILCHD
jgi:hypothetical protein